jgi:hypothetical protein
MNLRLAKAPRTSRCVIAALQSEAKQAAVRLHVQEVGFTLGRYERSDTLSQMRPLVDCGRIVGYPEAAPRSQTAASSKAAKGFNCRLLKQMRFVSWSGGLPIE